MARRARPRRGARGARDEGAHARSCCARKGCPTAKLKRGYGGIRDIEFAVQLLQLVHGRADRNVRARATLDALEQLAARRLRHGRRRRAARRRVRLAAHRRAPAAARRRAPDAHDSRTTIERARTSRAVLGFRDTPGESAVDDVRRRAPAPAGGRALDPREAVLRAAARHARRRRRAARGARPKNGWRRSASATSTRPAPRCSELTAGLDAPFARHAAAAARRSSAGSRRLPIPTSGCCSCGGSARATRGRRRSPRRFRETPIAAERTCRILGSSRVLGLALHRHPDVVDALADDAFVTEESHARPSSSRPRSRRSTGATTSRAPGRAAPLQAARAAAHRRARPRRVRANWSRSGASSRIARRRVRRSRAAFVRAHVPFAVIGLGRLGGRELSYASDIDVVFVYDGTTATDFDAAERLATALVRAIGDTTAEGADLPRRHAAAPRRQPGTARPLARRVPHVLRACGQTWEFQALTKARVVAGDREVGARFLDLVPTVRVPRPDARGVATRDPPHEGAHRARTHPARRRPAVPPQARTRLTVRRRVHRAARTARTRRCTARVDRSVDAWLRSTRSTKAGVLEAEDAEHLACRVRVVRTGAQLRATSSPDRPAMRSRSTATRREKLARMLGYSHARNNRCATTTAV